MSDFDPDRPCRVRDSLNGRTFHWQPQWADDYRAFAHRHAEGVVNFDGLLLDGREPLADRSWRGAKA